MIIKARVNDYLCLTAHPEGCKKNVEDQIAYVKAQGEIPGDAKKVLVIGCSTGYGLASRIVAAFGCHADTLGIMFERPSNVRKTASPGWYNTASFEQFANEEGVYAKTINGDAFSKEIKNLTIETIKKDLGKVDLVVYSLAAPRRTTPDGVTYRSVLKTTGEEFTNKNLNLKDNSIGMKSIPAATEEEVEATVKVMGGEDWKLWIEFLDNAGVLTENFKTVAYSYLGPKVTYGIYKEGTIGAAKRDLEGTSDYLNDYLKTKYNGEAYVSLSKALMTKASAVIPIFPLYATLLYKVMKAKGLHEGTIEQKQRLFKDMMYGGKPELDSNRRLRPDNWEMREDVQSEVEAIWDTITPENFKEIGDYEGVREEFMQLNGFDFDNIDYSADVNLEELAKLKP